MLAYGIARYRQIRRRRPAQTWRASPAFPDDETRRRVTNRVTWYCDLVEQTSSEVRWRRQSEVTIIWKPESHLRTALRVLPQRSARIVDPRFYGSAEANTHLRLQYHDVWTEEDRRNLRTESRQHLARLASELGGACVAHVLGTGPSVESILSLQRDPGIVIGCNSIVKSDSIMRELRPDVLVFSDPVFHFGISEYAEQFRRDLARVMDEYAPWLLAPAEYSATLLRHMPEVRPRLIAIDVRSSKCFNLVSHDQPWVRRTGNVLTGFMLPLAGGLSSRIDIYGCDGRDPNDVLFWAHNERTQYSDLYQTVIDTHPSFFADNDYVRYYEMHCKLLSEFFAWGEGDHGLEFRSRTMSYIPALNARAK